MDGQCKMVDENQMFDHYDESFHYFSKESKMTAQIEYFSVYTLIRTSS
jgi:hypothetical protein